MGRFVVTIHVLIAGLLLLHGGAEAFDISSVNPSAAAPGDRVSVTGGPFDEETTVLLGDQEVQPATIGEGQLVFAVPNIPEGEYLLFLRKGALRTPNSLSLRIVEPPPVIEAVIPPMVEMCSLERERRVVVEGFGFRPDSRLLLDGAAIPVLSKGETEIIFEPPPLTAGSHMVQVVNPGGRKSLPYSLIVNAVPEILSVAQGEEDVLSYQLLIMGRNFLYSSDLIVNGQRIPHSSLIPLQTGSLEYVDCSTLIYHRYPTSSQLNRVSIQVVNPGGLESTLYHVTIP